MRVLAQQQARAGDDGGRRRVERCHQPGDLLAAHRIDVEPGLCRVGAEIGILHKCEGQAKCGSCHIFVQEGRKGLSKIAREENEKLDSIVGVGSKSRLACQAKVLGTENITIELLGFGSGL